MQAVTIQQIVEEASEYLDTDPRFFNVIDGMFLYATVQVHFRKTEHQIFLFVDGVVEVIERR